MHSIEKGDSLAGRGRGRFVYAVATVAVLAAGCSSGWDDGADGADTPSGEQRTVRLLIRDGSLRVDGSPCSGSSGLIYIHRSAAFRVENDSGQQLAGGELPAGKAVKALDKDFGNARRIPTNCEFSFPVTVAGSSSYQLMFDEGPAIPLEPQDHPEEGRLLVGLVP